jgi:hypothetical protein
MVAIIHPWSPQAPPKAGKLDRIIQFLLCKLSTLDSLYESQTDQVGE